MNAVERRLAAIRLMELVKENPQYTEELGIKVNVKFKGNDSDQKERS